MEAEAARQVPCPNCQRPAVFAPSNRWRPFCSERCKVQDLAHWADGTYRVATEPVNPASEASDDDAD